MMMMMGHYKIVIGWRNDEEKQNKDAENGNPQ